MALDVIEVMDIADTVEAVRIGTGRSDFPRGWLELLEPEVRERLKWRESESQQESPGE